MIIMTNIDEAYATYCSLHTHAVRLRRLSLKARGDRELRAAVKVAEQQTEQAWSEYMALCCAPQLGERLAS
jgi:hypothetical protein